MVTVAFVTLSHCTYLMVFHLTTFLMYQVIFALTQVYIIRENYAEPPGRSALKDPMEV